MHPYDFLSGNSLGGLPAGTTLCFRRKTTCMSVFQNRLMRCGFFFGGHGSRFTGREENGLVEDPVPPTVTPGSCRQEGKFGTVARREGRGGAPLSGAASASVRSTVIIPRMN